MQNQFLHITMTAEPLFRSLGTLACISPGWIW